MIRMLKYFKWWYWLIILLIGVSVYFQVTLDLLLPERMAEIIKLVGDSALTGANNTKRILEHGYIMLLITLGSIVLTIGISLFASNVGANFAKTIRERIYIKVNEFSMGEINEFSTPSLITRSTNDVQQIQMAVIVILRMAITAPMMAFKAIVKIWSISNELSIIVAIGIFAIVTMITLISIFVMPKFQKMQKNTDNLNLVTRENLTGLRVIKAYNALDFQGEKFEEVNTELTKTNLFVNRAMSIMMPGMQTIMSIMNLAIVWLGAILISQFRLGATQFEGIALQSQFAGYAMNIVMSFMLLVLIFFLIPRAAVSAKRINEVLKTNSSIKDPKVKNEIKTNLHGTIEFVDVFFKYPNAEGYVLENINLKINQGETVAFLGSTGSGKSTLLNLIARFYDTSSGKVLINGIDIKDYSLSALYELLGYVPQKGLLFSGTIASNLKIGKDNATDEEIYQSLSIAQASNFVKDLPETIDYTIAQGGKNVSGGQKQRLCIARAIIKKPEIYLFDDSFSALDYRTDLALRNALSKETTGATNLIVATRIGTILKADKIVVLEQGQIVGIGTHQELLNNCLVYQEMAYSQLSKEELQYAK